MPLFWRDIKKQTHHRWANTKAALEYFIVLPLNSPKSVFAITKPFRALTSPTPSMALTPLKPKEWNRVQLCNAVVFELQFVPHVLGTQLRICSDASAVRGLQQRSPGNQGCFSCVHAVVVTLPGTCLIKNATSPTLPSCTCSPDTATAELLCPRSFGQAP